ncbi:MAG: hypothetical protein JNJ88_07600 [Planctomycetes bacterium]|nr:hypothetical protein [Planctomycetota bacterium]
MAMLLVGAAAACSSREARPSLEDSGTEELISLGSIGFPRRTRGVELAATGEPLGFHGILTVTFYRWKGKRFWNCGDVQSAASGGWLSIDLDANARYRVVALDEDGCIAFGELHRADGAPRRLELELRRGAIVETDRFADGSPIRVVQREIPLGFVGMRCAHTVIVAAGEPFELEVPVRRGAVRFAQMEPLRPGEVLQVTDWLESSR